MYTVTKKMFTLKRKFKFHLNKSTKIKTESRTGASPSDFICMAKTEQKISPLKASTCGLVTFYSGINGSSKDRAAAASSGELRR